MNLKQKGYRYEKNSVVPPPKDALEALERIIKDHQDPEAEGIDVDDYYTVRAALEAALRIADKLMQKPSDEMVAKCMDGLPVHPIMSLECKRIFKTMREQMLKEIK